MSDVKRLLAEATPLPWATWTNGFDGGIVSDADGRPTGDRYRMLIFGGEPNGGYIDPRDPDALLAVYAVNHLPDYEAAVDSLRRLCYYTDAAADCPYPSHDVCDHRQWLREETDLARAVLARLRGDA